MSIVTDATVIMKRAEEVIGDLMAVNARLRRENLALVEALERTLANFRNLLEQKPVRDASETIAESQTAIRLVKGVTQ